MNIFVYQCEMCKAEFYYQEPRTILECPGCGGKLELIEGCVNEKERNELLGSKKSNGDEIRSR